MCTVRLPIADRSFGPVIFPFITEGRGIDIFIVSSVCPGHRVVAQGQRYSMAPDRTPLSFSWLKTLSAKANAIMVSHLERVLIGCHADGAHVSDELARKKWTSV